MEKAAVNAAFSFDGISFYFILFPYRQAEAAAFFACSHSIFPLHKPVYIINKTEAFNLRLIYDISRRLKSDSHGRPAPAAPPAPAGGEMSSGTWTSFGPPSLSPPGIARKNRRLQKSHRIFR